MCEEVGGFSIMSITSAGVFEISRALGASIVGSIIMINSGRDCTYGIKNNGKEA